MLSQNEADALIAALKQIQNLTGPIAFPRRGHVQRLELASTDGKHSFLVDINRKGCVDFIKKCTYQGRYQQNVILLRLDVEGPEHTNPDGKVLPGTHLHVYREGYEDRYAIPIPPDIQDTTDLVQTLIDFLVYFRTTNTVGLKIGQVI